MSWQSAAETLIGRLTGPAATVVDLVDCLQLTSAVLAALTRQATGANALLLDAAVWDVDAARAHLADQPSTHRAGGVAPLRVHHDAAVRDIDAARAHLADQPGASWAAAAAPLELDHLAAPQALALCRRLMSAAVNAMDDAEDVAARQAVSSADRYLAQIAG